MYSKQSKALLFIILSIASTHQAVAEINPTAVKVGNTIAAIGGLVAVLVGAATVSESYSLPNNKLDMLGGSVTIVAALYLAGYITYKTHFEKQPVYPACLTCTCQKQLKQNQSQA